MSLCNSLTTKPMNGLSSVLRMAAVVAGVLMVAAGCVPVDAGYGGYDGYAAAPAYVPGPVYAPSYGYGGGVVLYGGSGGGNYDRGYGRGYDRRAYRGGGSGWRGNDGRRGGGQYRGNTHQRDNRPQANRPRNGLFPGLPAGPQRHQAAPNRGHSGGQGHDRRERR